jgi:hypothetical protein
LLLYRFAAVGVAQREPFSFAVFALVVEEIRKAVAVT